MEIGKCMKHESSVQMYRGGEINENGKMYKKAM